MPHHFSVDVEEYFQVSALERAVARAEWDKLESRIAPSVELLLELLAEQGARGTFFVLGWIAERHPELIRAVYDAGHEIASHGWGHRLVTRLTPEEFRTSARQSKRLLEDITGSRVIGFRAPNFSITRGHEWALDVLIEEGYEYDSSLYPVARRDYGYSNGARDPRWLERAAGRIAEFPPTTLRAWRFNVPAAGGAYFRVLPYALVRGALKDFERRGQRGTFYIHPWELDPDQPRLDVPWLTRVRHYGRLKTTAERLRRLLREFDFGAIADSVAQL